MANTTVKGKFNVVAENGDVQTIYPKTTGDQVLVDRSSNASVIPNDVANLQHIVNKMGSLALKSKVETSDFTTGTMINSIADLKSNTETGKIADATVVKDIESRVDTLENSNLVTVDELDAGLATKPDTEINDAVTSTSLTWSSKKLSDQLTTLNSNTSILTNRVNTLIELPDGATTNDARLEDIRNGYDGIKYDSPGDAVRGQNSAINKNLDYVRNQLGVWNINLLEFYHASENATTGYYIQHNNGIPRENQDYFATDFIPISGGQTYISNVNNYEQGAFYDSNKAYISGYTKINTPLQIPQNACFIRMSFKNLPSVLPWKLYQSDTLPDNNFAAGTWFSTPMAQVHSDITEIQSKAKNTDALFIRNLIGQDFTDGYYVHYSNGNILPAEKYCYSSYIAVYPETEYYCNANAHVAFYDSSKTFLSGTLINQSNPEYATGNITTPANCKFMIVSFMINKKSTTMLSHGDTQKAYMPVGKIKIDGLIVDLPKTIIVDINGSGNYSSISSAVENANSGDTIYIMSGIYNETIIVPNNKKINFIGENKLDTIIKNNNGNYANCPILMGAGKLENLTVYAQKDEQTDTNAQDYDGRSYAVHIERDSLYNDTLYIKNCILKSDFYPALGMGMRGGCTVLLEDTDFILGSTGGGTSALYAHDADNANYAGLQNLTIRNCRIINYRTADRYAVKLQSQERNGTTVNLTMQNVLTHSFGESNLPLETRNYYDGTSTNAEDFQGLINWRLSDDSYGNSNIIFDK